MKGLIVSSGTINNYKLLESIAREVDFIICADGGTDHIMKISKFPNLILGDLDSISDDALDYIKLNNIPLERYPSKKNKTDTHLAMDYLIEKGFNEIILMGVTGSRFDHSIANIFLLNELLIRGIKGKIIDDYNIIYLIDDYLEIEYEKDSFVSIIPNTEDGINVSLIGFLYLLNKKDINYGSTEGISNKIIESKGSIKIHKGKALIFISKD